MVRVRRKVAILVALLIISLSTVTFLTVKYVHTVRLFNSFYQSARETAEKAGKYCLKEDSGENYEYYHNRQTVRKRRT